MIDISNTDVINYSHEMEPEIEEIAEFIDAYDTKNYNSNENIDKSPNTLYKELFGDDFEESIAIFDIDTIYSQRIGDCNDKKTREIKHDSCSQITEDKMIKASNELPDMQNTSITHKIGKSIIQYQCVNETKSTEFIADPGTLSNRYDLDHLDKKQNPGIYSIFINDNYHLKISKINGNSQSSGNGIENILESTYEEDNLKICIKKE